MKSVFQIRVRGLGRKSVDFLPSSIIKKGELSHERLTTIDHAGPIHIGCQPSHKTCKRVSCCRTSFVELDILGKPYLHAFEDTRQFHGELDVSVFCWWFLAVMCADEMGPYREQIQ